MENIYIEGSHKNFFIPTVDFKAEEGHCIISGESFLEDTVEFYDPLVQWLEEYTTTIKKAITFEIKLTYFNTSTSRSLLDLLNVLKDFEEDGGQITINWYYDEDDIDMEEDIEDYMLDTDLDINMIPFE